MKTIAILVALSILPAAALARSHSSRGHITGFRTSTCKTSACNQKHPDGKYVHPISSRSGHSRHHK
jgi:hypothetical protein